MSTSLEEAVKDYLLPAMLNAKIVLEPKMQQLAAAWAVKTALMFQLKAAKENRQRAYAPSSNLKWLYDHRAAPEAPPGSQVWIAAVDARLGTATAQTGWHTATTSKPPLDTEVYFVTFSVGYLVFQVSGQDFRDPDHKTPAGQSLLVLQRPDCLIDYVRAVWPARSDTIRWPPSQRLTSENLPKFAMAEQTTGARMRTVSLPRVG
ncbi:MAG: hypothetical protein ACYDCI_10515 [Candidatus Limnocylindrales bacterium]